MQDPYFLLGVPRDADDTAIHQAYLAAVRRYPAERDPQAFKAIRSAYESIRDRRSRLQYALFDTGLPEPADLLERLVQESRPSRPGIDLFMELLRPAPRNRGR